MATYDGGSIYNLSYAGTASVILNDNTLSNNSADDEGGAIFNKSSFTGTAEIIINNSTLFGNSANSGYGGGILNLANPFGISSVTLNNSTLSDNSAGYGGALYNDGIYTGTAIISLINSTLSSNSAVIEGDTILNNEGQMHLLNTIVANSLNGADCVSSNGEPISNINNLIEDGSCNPDFSGDPLLGPLADNGGETLTHVLLPGSPAIDNGDNATCLSIDQRGYGRPVDGDGDDNPVCDIGAYEFEATSTSYIYLPIVMNNPAP